MECSLVEKRCCGVRMLLKNGSSLLVNGLNMLNPPPSGCTHTLPLLDEAIQKMGLERSAASCSTSNCSTVNSFFSGSTRITHPTFFTPIHVFPIGSGRTAKTG